MLFISLLKGVKSYSAVCCVFTDYPEGDNEKQIKLFAEVIFEGLYKCVCGA